MRLILGVAALALAMGGAASADEGSQQEETHEGRPHTHWWLELDPDWSFYWYAGGGVGQSRYQDYALFDDGSFTSRGTDDTATALRAFAGMGIGKYLAFEATYADFGEASSRAQSDGTGSAWNAGPQTFKIGVDGYDFSLLGRLPLADGWALFAKVGGAWLDVEFAVSLDAQCCGVIDAAGTVDNDNEGVTYGGGVQYDGWRPVRIVAEYGVVPFDVDFFADDGTLDWLAVSAAYRF